MNWTFWLNIVSPHLSEMLRALATMPNQNVTVVAEHGLSDRRKAVGWSTPDCSPARVVIKPSNTDIDQLIKREYGQGSVHIVGGGLKRGSLNRRMLPYLSRTGAMIGLMSETADSRGILGLARRAKYYLDRYIVEDKLDFILAMGQVGVQWYVSSGYNSSRIFPFIYVTKRPVQSPEYGSDWNHVETYRILYLGHFLSRKDGITAIRGLSKLTNYDWQFDLVGNGPDLERWKMAAARSGVEDRIRFYPAVKNEMIGYLLEHTDLLLLPSRYDGWGAVVNEALMYGVPVVCSDNCGAAELLREPWRGSTFKMGSAVDLEIVIRGWIERGKRNKALTERIRKWSSVLEGTRIAHYLVDIVGYVRDGGKRPSPPWY